LPEAKLADRPNCGGCKSPLFNGQPLTIEQGLFDKYLQGNDIPLLADFWAPWCGPCKAFAPQFEAAAKSLEPKVRLLKVNTENAQQIAARFSIQSIPSLVIFKDGKELTRVAGAMGSQELVRWVNNQIH
jgi:thioredoxin 2